MVEFNPMGMIEQAKAAASGFGTTLTNLPIIGPTIGGVIGGANTVLQASYNAGANTPNFLSSLSNPPAHQQASTLFSGGPSVTGNVGSPAFNLPSSPNTLGPFSTSAFTFNNQQKVGAVSGGGLTMPNIALPVSNIQSPPQVSINQKISEDFSKLTSSVKSDQTLPVMSQSIQKDTVLQPLSVQQPQQDLGAFGNSNRFAGEQISKVLPTWENTFGGIADTAMGKKQNTSDKPADLTYTEQLKTFYAGDEGYNKQVVDPLTGKESTANFKAPPGVLRDVAVPFAKKLWDLPRDDPAMAALYYGTPFINAGIPLVIGNIAKAPLLAPVIKPVSMALTNPTTVSMLNVGGKAVMGSVIGDQVARVGGYKLNLNPLTEESLISRDETLSQSPKSASERAVISVASVVPMFIGIGGGAEKATSNLENIGWKNKIETGTNKVITNLEKIGWKPQMQIPPNPDDLIIPFKPNEINTFPDWLGDQTLSQKIAYVNRPISASDIIGTQQQKIGSIMQPLQSGQKREMEVMFDQETSPFVTIYGSKDNIPNIRRDNIIDKFKDGISGINPFRSKIIHTHPAGAPYYPSKGDIDVAAIDPFELQGVASDKGVFTYNLKNTKIPGDLIATNYENIIKTGGNKNIGSVAYDKDRIDAGLQMLKDSGVKMEFSSYPNPLIKARKLKKSPPKLKLKSKKIKSKPKLKPVLSRVSIKPLDLKLDLFPIVKDKKTKVILQKKKVKDIIVVKDKIKSNLPVVKMPEIKLNFNLNKFSLKKK